MNREAAARAIDAFLRALGRDPDHEAGLAGTGDRVAAAFADDLLTGYAVDVDALLSRDAFPGQTELVVVRDIPVTTTCPHHLMPSTGTATVAFAPKGRLLGLGTVVRLVDAYARRLALQEAIGEAVVAALQKHVTPRWAACRIDLSHSCMTARGGRSHGARAETLAVAGEGAARTEVYTAIGVGKGS